MPITPRRIRDPHTHSDTALQESHPQQRQVKQPSAGLLSIILRVIVMCVLASLFFLFVSLATILLILVFLDGRKLRRRRRRQIPSHSPNAFSRENLSQLAESKYCSRDRDAVSDPECVICLDEFGDGVRCRVLPGCGHVFHLNCIDAWLVKSAVCPICRASVRLSAARSVDQKESLTIFDTMIAKGGVWESNDAWED